MKCKGHIVILRYSRAASPIKTIRPMEPYTNFFNALSNKQKPIRTALLRPPWFDSCVCARTHPPPQAHVGTWSGTYSILEQKSNWHLNNDKRSLESILKLKCAPNSIKTAIQIVPTPTPQSTIMTFSVAYPRLSLSTRLSVSSFPLPPAACLS